MNVSVRNTKGAKKLPLIIILLVILYSLPGLADITGKPRVVDGDTIYIGSTKIRLWGFDAPEQKQTCMNKGKAWDCGIVATVHLKTFIGNNLVKCVQKDLDRYKRIVAKCSVGTLDIGAEMVEVGLAIPYWKYSGKYYIQSYKEARGLGRGIHAGTFVEPWEWRRGKRLSSPSADVTKSKLENLFSIKKTIPLLQGWHDFSFFFELELPLPHLSFHKLGNGLFEIYS
jgi:endonuclease YncB( thermonuclease family)